MLYLGIKTMTRTRILMAACASMSLLSAPVGAQTAPAAPAAAPAAPAAPTNPDDVIRCRSMEVTGSLARRERVCKTVGEWRRLADRGNENARDIVDYSRGRPSGQ